MRKDELNDKAVVDHNCYYVTEDSFIGGYVQSLSGSTMNQKTGLNDFCLFIRKLLPSFSLNFQICSLSSCFICGATGGHQIHCRVPQCKASCHPLCYKQCYQLEHSISDIISRGVGCPQHRGVDLRAMKQPRSQHPTESEGGSRVQSMVQQRQDVQKFQASQQQEIQQQEIPRDSQPAVVTPEDSEDDGEVCDICGMGYSEPDDMLVFCDRCNLAVHQGCYGVSKLPEGEWLCSVCRQGRLPQETRCCLCLHEGGAMHRTIDGRFIHLICVYYTPELSLDLKGPEVLVRGMGNIDPERAQLTCCICGQKGAGCIQCNSRNCSVAYHPFCASKAGYLLTSDEKHGRFMYLSYCAQHSKLKEAKKRTKSATSTPEKKRKRQGRRKKMKKEEPEIPTGILTK